MSLNYKELNIIQQCKQVRTCFGKLQCLLNKLLSKYAFANRTFHWSAVVQNSYNSPRENINTVSCHRVCVCMERLCDQYSVCTVFAWNITGLQCNMQIHFRSNSMNLLILLCKLPITTSKGFFLEDSDALTDDVLNLYDDVF